MICKCKEIFELNGREAEEYAHMHLKKLRVDGQTWQIEYICPETTLKFIMDFPQSEAQGGGPPRLIRRADSISNQ